HGRHCRVTPPRRPEAEFTIAEAVHRRSSMCGSSRTKPEEHPTRAEGAYGTKGAPLGFVIVNSIATTVRSPAEACTAWEGAERSSTPCSRATTRKRGEGCP